MRSGSAGWPTTGAFPAELDLHISADPGRAARMLAAVSHSRSADSLTHRPGDPALTPATYLYWWLRGCPRMKLKEGIQVMSVLVIAKFQGDVARFRQALADHGGDFAKMAENARTSGGGIHHRFAVGDGFVVVVDEWETAGHFEKFFADPDLQALIAASGAAPGPPEITIAAAITSPDQY